MVVNNKKNIRIAGKSSENNLIIFLFSVMKNITSINGIFYRGLKFSNLTNNKLLKLVILFVNVLFKQTIDSLLSVFSLLIETSLIILLFIIKILIHLCFNKIFKIALLKHVILKLVNKILYFRQFISVTKLINKRRSSVDFKVIKKRLNLIKKEKFRQLLIRHIEITRKIKLTKRQKIMLMRKIRKKKTVNKKLKIERSFIGSYLLNFIKLEENAFNFTNNINDNLISIFSRINYIISNILRILRVFEKNKKINHIKKIIEYIFKKLTVFSKYFNIISDHLDLIVKLNKLFKFLFFKNFFKLRSGKKSGKLYFKTFYKYYFFNIILIILSTIKILILADLFLNNQRIKNFVERIDIFLNFEDYIKQSITNIRFI